MRRGFHDDIWIASIENKIRNSSDNVVLSDCRFPNEIASIRNAGGRIVRTCRGPDPEWFPAAEVVNRGPTLNLSWASNRSVLDNFKVHASETAWVGTDFDHVLDNNSSMDHLYVQLNDLVLNLRVSKQDPV
jgi:hypothetical protein